MIRDKNKTGSILIFVMGCTIIGSSFFNNIGGVVGVIIGTIIGYLGVATNYLLWYDIPIPPIGNWTAAFYLAIVAYAILKYRLMDIRMAIKRSTIFSGIVIISAALFASF